MKKLPVILLFLLMSFSANESFSQCSMCTANAENGSKNGNTQTKGINKGVLYLLSIPFTMVGGIGLLWYTKFRTPKA